MQNLWDDTEAAQFSDSELSMRVYTSRLLGRNADLVLHGGGNTSVKVIKKNLFGDEEEILYVKGSGWDLKTIEAAGFAPTKMQTLKRLGSLPHLSDTDMTRELKAALTDPGAPAPSVEAILHALVPRKFVDHTHTDAVVAISNTANGEKILSEIYGPSVLILPYVMPGFILSKQVYEATLDTDWDALEGIILLHHGLFTFDDDARRSYSKMIELVSKAEDYLSAQGSFDTAAEGDYQATVSDYRAMAAARQQTSQLYGYPMLARWQRDRLSVGYSQIDGIEAIATRGPVTPDHTIHTKRTPAILDKDPRSGIENFVRDYQHYFEQHNDGTLTCLDPAPRFAIWKNQGTLVFSPNSKRLAVVADILQHTQKAVQWGESLGGWQALSAAEIFELEYWELEQAKLKRGASRKLYEGKVALVTGAASGIGRACAEELMQQGAAVIALDINPAVSSQFSGANSLGVRCDVTQCAQIIEAIEQGIETFGGIDIVISNAGSFPPSVDIQDLSDDDLQNSMALNFNAHVRLIRESIPYLKLGFDPCIIIVASKNVPAPGPGAGAYSAAKAALTQMARVAALELGADGIRVNIVHPNAVFDTGVWSDEVLQQRAQHYDMSVEQYKTNNVLQTAISSVDVAKLVATMAGPAFAKTTGAQIPVDGGNDRVI